jgi:hypothetical protein
MKYSTQKLYIKCCICGKEKELGNYTINEMCEFAKPASHIDGWIPILEDHICPDHELFIRIDGYEFKVDKENPPYPYKAIIDNYKSKFPES